MKRILVLSGGGSRGAIQAGALLKLSERRDFNDYDMICGTSVGALGAAFLAQAPRGKSELRQKIKEYVSLWSTINGNGDIYQENIFSDIPILGAIVNIYTLSKYDSSPLRNLLNRYIHWGNIRCGSRDVRVGVYKSKEREYEEKSLTFSADPMSLVLGSAAIPFVFPPVDYYEEKLFDGGVHSSIPYQFLSDLQPNESVHIDIVLASTIHKHTRKESLQRYVEMGDLRKLPPAIVAEVVNRMRLIPFLDYARSSDRVRCRVMAPESVAKHNMITFHPRSILADIRRGYRLAPVDITDKKLGFSNKE